VHPERRRSTRHPIDLEIRVNGGTAFAMNLSSGGVYFEIDAPLVPEQEIALTFPFEHAAPPGTRATCSARVVRVERRGARYGVAVSYDRIAFEVP
jgi:hypothetical protein